MLRSQKTEPQESGAALCREGFTRAAGRIGVVQGKRLRSLWQQCYGHMPAGRYLAADRLKCARSGRPRPARPKVRDAAIAAGYQGPANS